MSTYLKDTLHCNQLVGVNTMYNWDLPYNELEDMIALPKIDVVGTNVYYSNPEAQFKMSNYVLRNWQKRGGNIPVMISEGGTDGNYIECSSHSMHKIDVSTLPMTMVCGFNAWYGDTNAYNKYWPYTIRAQQHFNANDVIETLSSVSGTTHEQLIKYNFHNPNQNSSDPSYAIEYQLFVSNDKSKLVGYIRNNSYNLKTEGCHVLALTDPYAFKEAYREPLITHWDDFPKNERIRIENLIPETNYTVHWYSPIKTTNNGYVKTDCLLTKKKNNQWGFYLKYPTLGTSDIGNYNLPLYWFVIQQGCSNNLAVQNSREMDFALDSIKPQSEEKIYDDDLEVYPNPFGHLFYIDTPIDDELQIESLAGALISKQKITKGKNRILTENLASGFYQIRLLTQNLTIKMVKL